MLWLKLKPSLIPCVAQEVSQVSDLYELMLSEVPDRQKLKELSILQASIKGRIQELDEFFDENPTSPYLPFFEKQRLKLRKLLQREPPQPVPETPSESVIEPNESVFSTDDYIKELLQKPKPAAPPKPLEKTEWNEIVFKIKLTKKEYLQLMKIKAQRAYRGPF